MAKEKGQLLSNILVKDEMCLSLVCIFKITTFVNFMYVLEVERTSKYRTSNTSNIDTPNFEHFEHDAQILRPNFEQARPNIELLLGSIRPEFLAHIRVFFYGRNFLIKLKIH